MLEDTNTRRADAASAVATEAVEQEYKVGPGRPRREYQFKPGQSGNPKGAQRKQAPIVLDLKAALQQALNKKVKLKQGDKERLVSMATAGIEQLVAQFAKGERHARRDLIALADKLGVRPEWASIFGSISSCRNAFKRASVLASLIPIRRE